MWNKSKRQKGNRKMTNVSPSIAIKLPLRGHSRTRNKTAKTRDITFLYSAYIIIDYIDARSRGGWFQGLESKRNMWHISLLGSLI